MNKKRRKRRVFADRWWWRLKIFFYTAPKLQMYFVLDFTNEENAECSSRMVVWARAWKWSWSPQWRSDFWTTQRMGGSWGLCSLSWTTENSQNTKSRPSHKSTKFRVELERRVGVGVPRAEEKSSLAPLSLIPAVSELLQLIWTERNWRCGINEERLEPDMDILSQMMQD